MRNVYCFLLLVSFIFNYPLCTKAQTPYPTTTKVSDVLGVVHQYGRYHFTTDNFMKEGVDEIEAMGTSVLKLFMGRSTATYYPSFWGCNWPNLTTNTYTLTDLAQTSYFQDAFNRTQFKTYVLSTFEMTNGANVTNFKDGLSSTEATKLYNEIYNLTTYFYNTYNGSGKTFILANWEADGMLGFVNENPLPSTAVQDTRIAGMIDWFNVRQNAITDARNAAISAGKSNVTVLGAAEFNHVNIRASYAWPTAIDRVIPYLHMDLYSFSNWKSNTPTTVNDFNATMDYIKAKCPDSQFGANNIYLGETGTFELDNVTGTNLTVHTTTSDRMSREIMQRNTEMALKYGVRYILHWEIFCNGLLPGITLPPGDNATEDQLRGTGIRRADGSYAGTYSYYKSIMSKTLGEYLHVYEAEAQSTTTSSGDTEADILQSGSSGTFFSKLTASAVGDYIQYTLRQTQTGSCYIKVKYRKGPSYGKFKLTLGSQPPYAVVDCYSSTSTFGETTFGPFNFATLPDTTGYVSYNYKFTVDGKTGTNYDLGIDAITIEPVNNAPYFNASSSLDSRSQLFDLEKADKEDAVFNSLNYYPNPATNRVSIEFNTNYTLELFNMSGQKVLQKTGWGGKQEIDVSALGKGMYVMKVTTNGKTAVRKLLLK